MDEDNLKNKDGVRDMFEQIAPRYDLLNRLLSFGIDRGWRKKLSRKLVAQLLDRSRTKANRVLDVATGTADLIVAFEKESTKQRLENREYTGIDITQGMVEIGREKLKKRGLSAELKVADAMNLPFGDDRFAAVSCAFGVRNFPDARRGVSEMYRVLCSGGGVYILEYSPSEVKGLWGAIFRFYFKRVLPTIGGWVSGSKAAYEYLPASVDDFLSASEFKEVLLSEGFTDVEVRQLMGGVVTLYSAIKN